MKSGKYLAIDLGAGSGRAIIGELIDNKIHLTEVHRFSNPIVKVFDSIHWNFLHLFSEIKNSMSKAVKLGHTDIESIAVDTWGVDFGLINKEGQLLGSPFAYRDSRTDGMIKKANEHVSNEEIYKATGIQFMQINTIFQLFSMVYSNDSLLRATSKLLFMPDLINYFLTGEIKTEYTIASTSQLLNANSKSWDEGLFRKLNIPINIMAPIIEPGTKVGSLLSSICEPLGINNINVVSVGSHDTASAVAAVPNMGSNWAFISSGTWSLIGVETDSPIINEKSSKYNFTNEGGVGNKIRFLRNVMGMWIIQQLKTEWEKDGNEYSFEDLNNLAEESTPFQCIIDTDDSNFLNPESMINAIHNFCIKTNQEIPADKGSIIRAVLESLALKYRTIIDRINELREDEIEIINIVGGGSQNTLLNQFTANATGLKVIIGPVEATAYGNLMMQGIANGKIDSIEAGREIINNSIELETFLPINQNDWETYYIKAREVLK